MTTLDTPILESDGFAKAYQTLQQTPAGATPDWLRKLRQQGWTYFEQLGWPTSDHEEWRYTSIKSLTQISWESVSCDRPHTLTREKLEALQLPGSWAAILVFEDGVFRPEFSELQALPQGVTVKPLAHAVAHHPDLVQKHLGKLASGQEDALAALNTALITDGAFVWIPRNLVVERPILVLCLAGDSGEARYAAHLRHLIIVEDSGSATMVEHYAALTPQRSFSNTLTEAFVGNQASLTHYAIEEESLAACCVAALHSRQGRDSRFASHTALLGGQLVRNDVHVELAGDRAWSLLNGLFVPSGTQHMDNHMRVVHACEHGDSRQFYKGVLNDQATGVFTGRIVVREGAQKTDAKQTNRNLLLSDKARITARPQLEIYADDVKCTHGATTGQLDENALFYLQARGIPTDQARAMLIDAFAQESLERMELPEIREYLGKKLREKLSAQ